jgi:hypothetical protein
LTRIRSPTPLHSGTSYRLPENRLGAVPIDLKLSLKGVEAGEYQCQVTVLDPSKDRAAFWQGPLAIVH